MKQVWATPKQFRVTVKRKLHLLRQPLPTYHMAIWASLCGRRQTHDRWEVVEDPDSSGLEVCKFCARRVSP